MLPRVTSMVDHVTTLSIPPNDGALGTVPRTYVFDLPATETRLLLLV